MLISAVILQPATSIAKENLTIKECQSVLAQSMRHNMEGFYINTSDLNGVSGKSSFYDEFVASADLIHHKNPVKEILLHQNPFIKENQKRTNLRFFAYLTN